MVDQLRVLGRVGNVTESCAGVRNHAGYDGIVLVCVRPVVNCGATGGLSEDDDPIRVAAETKDVVFNPFHCRALVAKTGVLFDTWSTGEAKDSKTVVHCYHDHVFIIGEVLAGVEWGVRSVGVSCISVVLQSHQ